MYSVQHSFEVSKKGKCPVTLRRMGSPDLRGIVRFWLVKKIFRIFCFLFGRYSGHDTLRDRGRVLKGIVVDVSHLYYFPIHNLLGT